MSNITSILDRMCSQLENERKRIRDKKNNIEGTWKGTAQESYSQMHDEMEWHMQKVISQIHNMNNTVRNLTSSMQAADRDKAAKKAVKGAK